MPESHTGEHVANVLMEAVKEWQLPTTFGNPPVVSDNASNMTKAGEIFGSLHVKCYAHTLNLAVQKCLAVKRVDKLLCRIRRIVAFFHRNNIASAILQDKTKALSLPQHKLIIDVSTRWNSAYDMVARFLELQVAVLATLRTKEVGKEKETDMRSFTDDDFSLAEDIVKLLKPLKDITTMLCSEQVPTVSIIMPLQYRLLKHILIVNDDDSPAISEMKLLMNNDLIGRYKSVSSKLNMFTALDPRFKHLPYLSSEDGFQVFNSITNAAANLKNAVKVKVEPNDDTVTNNHPQLPSLDFDIQSKTQTEFQSPHCSTADQDFCTAPPIKKVKLEGQSVIGEIFGDVFITAHEPPKTPHDLSEMQVSDYKKTPSIPLDADPLQWWKTNEHRFPLIANLAKVYLCIPATSVPSERVFSTAGDILNAQRSRLKSKHVDTLIFLKKNLI